MARCEQGYLCDVCGEEVEEIVDTGEIDGDSIHTPGSYVDRIVKTKPEKRIEQRTVSK